MRTIEISVAILIALVIAGAFFAGLSTDASTFFSGLGSLVNTLQGRTANGTFPSYPANAPAKVQPVKG